MISVRSVDERGPELQVCLGRMKLSSSRFGESWRWGGEREGLSLDGGEGEERGRDWRLHLITHQVKKNSGWLLDMQQITRQGRHWLSWGRLLKAQVHCGRKSGLGAGWLDRLILSGSERGRFSHPHHLGNGLRGFNLSYMVQRRF